MTPCLKSLFSSYSIFPIGRKNVQNIERADYFVINSDLLFFKGFQRVQVEICRIYFHLDDDCVCLIHQNCKWFWFFSSLNSEAQQKSWCNWRSLPSCVNATNLTQLFLTISEKLTRKLVRLFLCKMFQFSIGNGHWLAKGCGIPY